MNFERQLSVMEMEEWEEDGLILKSILRDKDQFEMLLKVCIIHK